MDNSAGIVPPSQDTSVNNIAVTTEAVNVSSEGVNLTNTTAQQQVPGSVQVAKNYPPQVLGIQTSGSVSATVAGKASENIPEQQPTSQNFGGVKTSKKEWHSSADDEARQAMQNHIIDVLKMKRPNMDVSWTDKLPQMARRLENALYQDANSVAEYKDHSTLKARLQQLAQAFPRKQQSSSSTASGSNQVNSSQDSRSKVPGQVQTQEQADHRRQVLKHQQQRLLLLRHASKCQSEGQCRATPFCAAYKVLWKHIMKCKEQRCPTAHCVSSRFVLNHYSKCDDKSCEEQYSVIFKGHNN
jgi:hypothetical protein